MLKLERNNLITGEWDASKVAKKENTSIDQYKSYLNNSNAFNDSLMKWETDELFMTSVESKEHQTFKNNLPKEKKNIMRSSSISSSNISLISETTSSAELIGWSYQQTRDGKLYNMTQDFEWRQLYQTRYINERVEVELIEFKEEIEKKFKHSKWK